jgi:hypothetical protein
MELKIFHIRRHFPLVIFVVCAIIIVQARKKLLADPAEVSTEKHMNHSNQYIAAHFPGHHNLQSSWVEVNFCFHVEEP